jgi:hypothetical protein
MSSRWIRVALVAALFAIAAPVAYADGDDDDEGSSVRPLTGETLLASEIGNPGTSTVTGTCDPLGTSTFTFTITGLATGPYPGPFTETGTIVLGPFGVPGNPLAATSFESSFTISSPAGTVTGTKSLEGFAAASLGLCAEAGAADSLRFEGNVGYSATITAPSGTGTDSGISFVNLGDTQIRDVPGNNGFNFLETYTSDRQGSCEDDDDDGGGDCEDEDEDEDEDDDDDDDDD